MASGAFAMGTKGNVVSYLDKELVEKSKELGFNLSKTFENQSKLLITQFSTVNSVNNFKSTDKVKARANYKVEPALKDKFIGYYSKNFFKRGLSDSYGVSFAF